MSAMSRRKGARAEVDVVNWLRSVGWPDARRYLAGDGRQPGDVDWHPLVALEVKDCARSAWPTWCRQAASEARPGMVPAVVRKTAGVRDVRLWEVRVRGTEWLTVLGAPFIPRGVDLPKVDHGHDVYPWVPMTMDELANAVAAVDER